MSNLKQLGLALLMYAQDNDESFSNADIALPDDTGFFPGGIWYTKTLFWPQILYPYHKSTQVFYCPSGAPITLTTPYRGNYGVNQNLMPDNNHVPPKLVSVISPATTYMFLDAGQWKTYAASTTNDVINPITGGTRYVPGIGAVLGEDGANGIYDNDFDNGRHFGGINVAFVDGHVKWLLTSTVYAQAKMSGRGAWNPATP